MTGYAFAPGAPFSGDANEVQAELERIKRTGDGLTPEAVVTVARMKSSPLHPLIFNVPAKVAAERYYQGRATTLIGAIRVVNEEGEVTHLRANVLVRVGETETYRGLSDEAARNQRAAWLRGRLLSIRTELRELDLYPQVALAIEAELEEALAA